MLHPADISTWPHPFLLSSHQLASRPHSTRKSHPLSYLRPYSSNTSYSSSYCSAGTHITIVSKSYSRAQAHSVYTQHSSLGIHICSSTCIWTQMKNVVTYHRLLIFFSRRTQERVPLNTHRLRPGYDYSPPIHIPQPITQQPRYLAEGTDWWVLDNMHILHIHQSGITL